MNWFINILQKEARSRRFKDNDQVRYYTDSRKGKGQGIVLTPRFNSGTVVGYDVDNRRYKVRTNVGEEIDVHPRNLVPESTVQKPLVETPVEIIETVEPVEITGGPERIDL